jgi:ribosomal protein L34E
LPAGTIKFTFQKAQKGSGDHLASYSMDTGGSFLEIKQPGCKVRNSFQISAKVKNKWSSTANPLQGVNRGQLNLFAFYHKVIGKSGGTACSRERRNVRGVLVGKSERKNPLENPGADGKIILRWIFRNWDVGK